MWISYHIAWCGQSYGIREHLHSRSRGKCLKLPLKTVATALHMTYGLNKQVSEGHIFSCAALKEEKKENVVCVQRESE